MSVPLDQMGGGMPGGGTDAEQSQFPMAEPEAQKLGVKAIENMLDVIYGDQWETVLSELESAQGDALTEAVGRMVATMYIIQEAMAMAAGKELPQEIALDVGEQMVEEMFLILDTQGIYSAGSEEEEQKKMAEAELYAAKYYRMHLESEGRFNEEGAMELGQALRSGAYDGSGPPPGQAPGVGGPGEGGGMPPEGGGGPAPQPMPSQGGGVPGGPAPAAPGGPGGLLEKASQAARGRRP